VEWNALMRGGEKQHTSSRTILTMDNRTSLGMIVIYVTVAGIDICHGQILYTSHIISSLICYYAISIAAFSCVNINVKSLKTAMVAVASVLSIRNDRPVEVPTIRTTTMSLRKPTTSTNLMSSISARRNRRPGPHALVRC
jgi:hypothetical protein